MEHQTGMFPTDERLRGPTLVTPEAVHNEHCRPRS
jgi:hypothetical protein